MERRTRVRFAPSPTGYLHIGGLRTALYNYFFAKKSGGDFILRIEDTDQSRFVPEAEDYIRKSFEWCGIEFDESPWNGGLHAPYRQSERKPMYKQYAMQLLENGSAYYAFDTSEELDTMRANLEAQGNPAPQYNYITRQYMKNSLTLPHDEVQRLLASNTPYVIRIKMPRNEEIKCFDLIRGWVIVNTAQMDDKVLMKSDGMPTYHLANVVDDYTMLISHVIRAEEWLPSLPLHVFLYQCFGWVDTMPQFAHLPVVLRPDGNGKLSKRDGDTLGFPVFPLAYSTELSNSNGFKEMGFTRDAFVNMLAFLGWNPGTPQEIFSFDELIQAFSLERIGKSGARFDFEKAKWFNQQHLAKADAITLLPQLKAILASNNCVAEDNKILTVWNFVNDRCIFINDFWREGHYFFVERETIDEAIIVSKSNETTKLALTNIIQSCKQNNTMLAVDFEKIVKDEMTLRGLKPGDIFPLIRVLLSGEKQGPPMFEMMQLLGHTCSLNRLSALA